MTSQTTQTKHPYELLLYLCALATTLEADPATLRILQRRCYKPRLPSAVSSTASYAVRLNHVPGTLSLIHI